MKKYVLHIAILIVFIISGISSFATADNKLHSNIPLGIGSPINQTGPEDYKLYQNFPNPFNPSTKISYKINQEGYVKLSVFNLVGQEIETLVNEYQAAGKYDIEFNAKDLPSGIYLYKLQVNGYTSVKRMTLIR
jgi:hypothetical protein